ncbi:hypothetical protein Taro_051688 [Colocasia esculenta]|uniref:Ataxin-10 domain-containing protein n=1 Tax=Colocasia esculenta TaxID=4460 RepID=A0A843XGM0_COLES|nr:hypothetical protein [Colocasia esculenta]
MPLPHLLFTSYDGINPPPPSTSRRFLFRVVASLRLHDPTPLSDGVSWPPLPCRSRRRRPTSERRAAGFPSRSFANPRRPLPPRPPPPCRLRPDLPLPLLIPTFRLVRNLCVGEPAGRTAFLVVGGTGAVASFILCGCLVPLDVARVGLQLMGNVEAAGEKGQRGIWDRFFPEGLLELARVREAGACDALRMDLPLLWISPPESHPLPTGSPAFDVLGYSLTILRDLCASHDSPSSGSDRLVVESLVSSGLCRLHLALLWDLEPPSVIRRTLSQRANKESSSASPSSSKVCPYRGFHRDVVAVIGNCTCDRKQVQDEIRQQNGILLLLQQCVVDEDNPYSWEC